MKPSFVVDASVAMAWCFTEEATQETSQLLERMYDEVAVVPAWWYIELTNVLSLAERKARISTEDVAEFISMIESLQIESDNEAAARAFGHLLPLCRTHRLTSYDAIYLDLALRRQLPLATLDAPLRVAAALLGVELLAT